MAISAISFPSMRLASSFVIEEETLPELPQDPIEIPSAAEQLTNKFLLKQSSILSAEAAARTLTLLVSTIEEHVKAFLEATSELSNLYELGSHHQLTEAGQDRTLQLRQVINEERKRLHDLELVFAYMQKLMEINSQITFLLDAEYSSTKASQEIHTAATHTRQKFNAVKLAELDLARAHQSHIEKLGSNQKNKEK